MERVQTLSDRLQDQLTQHAPVADLLLTVQMLQSELLHLQSQEQSSGPSVSVFIDIPRAAPAQEPAPAETKEAPVENTEEKWVEMLQVDEADVEAELEEIRKNAKALNAMGQKNRPAFYFDPVEDTPTLFHQQPPRERRSRELNEQMAGDQPVSLNETLRKAGSEISDTLKDAPIRDLKKAIGVNDRFLYIKELFRGDEVMYERSIKTINGYTAYPEAEYWIKRELKLKLGWDEQSDAVKSFDQLVKRRFSAM